MIVHYPLTTNLLTEARLYATDSIQHTMDYEGWQDQHKKRERIVYGNFGQLWVAEFCRINGIPCQKDRSSPERADDYDLIAHGFKIDVKTSIHKDLVGQVSPGVINKPVDYFCFMLTDRLCSYIAPYGLIAADEYVLTAEFKINLLRAARGDRLHCIGTVLKPGRRLIVAESEVFDGDPQGARLVAKATVTLAVMKKPSGETESPKRNASHQ